MRRRAFLGGVLATSLAGCTSQSEMSKDYTAELDAPALGTRDAPSTIEVFTDYSCHYCRDYVLQVFPTVRAKLVRPGDALYVHYDFPFLDEWSWKIAYVARWIQAEHGISSYWVFHPNIYASFGEYSVETIARVASQATGADVTPTTVQEVIAAKTYRETILAEKQYGEQEYDVSGTPYVFVDGKRVKPSYQAIANAV